MYLFKALSFGPEEDEEGADQCIVGFVKEEVERRFRLLLREVDFVDQTLDQLKMETFIHHSTK